MASCRDRNSVKRDKLASTITDLMAKMNSKKKSSKSVYFTKRGKKYMRMITNDGVRDILIPTENHVDNRVFLPSKAFSKVLEDSVVVTQEQKEAMRRRYKLEQERLAEESAQRKRDLIQSQPEKRPETPPLHELEAEAKKEYLIMRAQEQIEDNLQEVKHCNKVILETTCQAVRVQQMNEKALQMYEEKEQMRQEKEKFYKNIAEESKRVQKEAKLEKEKRKQFCDVILDQIQAREKTLEAENIEKHRMATLAKQSLLSNQLAEIQDYKKKVGENKELRNFMLQVIEQAKHLKAIEREEDRLDNLKIEEFRKAKEEEEAKWQAEQDLKKKEKELELRRNWEQEKTRKAQQDLTDTMNESRIIAEVDKKWRDTEKENAIKRKNAIENFNMERERNKQDKLKVLALEMERSKEEFFKIVEVRRAQIKKEKEEERIAEIKRDAYRVSILQQVNEHERNIKKNRAETWDEGKYLMAAERNKKICALEAIKKRIEKARKNNLPELYIKEVERQLKVNQPEAEGKPNKDQ